MTWSKGHSGSRVCLGCGGLADCKPINGCQQSEHWNRHTTKTERNAAYRREQRATARARGTVYRKGRGNLVHKAAYNISRHKGLRDRVFAVLGGAFCVQCGFADQRALQFDHINGGGRRHRASLPSGSAYYLALRAMTDEQLRSTFQVLCANCNAIKREERREWEVNRAGKNPAEKDQRLPPSS